MIRIIILIIDTGSFYLDTLVIFINPCYAHSMDAKQTYRQTPGTCYSYVSTASCKYLTGDTSMNETTTTTTETISFSSYDSKQEYPAPDNMRLVKCLYKGDKQSKNSYCFIPKNITPESILEHWEDLEEFIVGYFEEVQDSKVKQYHSKGGTAFGTSFTSIENLIQFLHENGKGQRLSGDLIREWFNTSLSSGLGMYLRKSYPAYEDEKIEALLDYVCEKLMSLASPKVTWTDKEIEKLLPLVKLADDSAVVTKKLLRRIENMKVSESLIDSL